MTCSSMVKRFLSAEEGLVTGGRPHSSRSVQKGLSAVSHLGETGSREDVGASNEV